MLNMEVNKIRNLKGFSVTCGCIFYETTKMDFIPPRDVFSVRLYQDRLPSEVFVQVTAFINNILKSEINEY
jgi:hypothetical protein